MTSSDHLHVSISWDDPYNGGNSIKFFNVYWNTSNGIFVLTASVNYPNIHYTELNV